MKMRIAAFATVFALAGTAGSSEPAACRTAMTGCRPTVAAIKSPALGNWLSWPK